jgi:hypothetical protein
LYALSNMTQVISTYILSLWTNKSDTKIESKNFYFGFYILIGSISCKNLFILILLVK